jgi:hypothetical protein
MRDGGVFARRGDCKIIWRARKNRLNSAASPLQLHNHLFIYNSIVFS